MQIFTHVPHITDQAKNVSIALGTFDGIHIGHQKIIKKVVQLAKINNGKSIVFTFSNHPLEIIDPANCPQQIISQEEKADLIQSLGVDILINIPFTKDLLTLSPLQFSQLLKDKLTPKHIVVGSNFGYGYKSAGTPQTLKQDGKYYGFDVEIVDTVYVDKMIASSTLIRKFISDGEISLANKILARHFSVKGTIIKGDGRGRLLGFPTANLAVPKKQLIPANGVYAVFFSLRNKYNAVANIGTNPTFQVNDKRFEVHVLNYSGDLYEQHATVSFLERLRDEIQFAHTEELIQQINSDIQHAQNYYVV